MCFGATNAFHGIFVPDDFLAQSISHITEMIGFGEWPYIAEWTASDGVPPTCIKPLLMVPRGGWQKWFGRREVVKFVFGEQQMLAVV